MPTYHALLIGIDAYDLVPPLHGGVNDVDALAAILAQVAPLPLKTYKLVAPHASHRTLASDEARPTRDRIIEALQTLTRSVGKEDRVLVYYSGHGTSEFVPEAVATREALVPVDFNNGAGLLWDLELAALLDGVFAACLDLTVVLDACHSAGATRDLVSGKGLTARQITLTREQRSKLAPPSAALVGAVATARGFKEERSAVRGYTVVAAAHSFQKANEMAFPDGHFGLLSHSLFEVLRGETKEKLGTLRWADIWARICQLVWACPEKQHPALIGPRENRIFGGPPGPSAEGIMLRQGASAGTYQIDAGELVGAGVGARIAVYRELPPIFPPLGSQEEQALARLGELRIVSATEFSATGVPVAGSSAFELPPSACARLIAAAPGLRLKVALAADLDPAIGAALRSGAAADGVVYVDTDRAQAEAYLGRGPDGSLWLGDRTFGPGPELEPRSPGPLIRIELSDSIDEMVRCARALLRRYADYVVPLRLARRSELVPGQKLIEIEVIACPDKARLRALEEKPESAQALPRDANGRVCVRQGDKVAFAINNLSPRDLHFVLLGCTASGRIERLSMSRDADVGHESRKIVGQFDARDPRSGLKPFTAGLSSRSKLLWGVDRLVAFATNEQPLLAQMEKLADSPDTDRSFAGVVESALIAGLVQPRDFTDGSQLVWTAVSLEVQIGAPPA